MIWAWLLPQIIDPRVMVMIGNTYAWFIEPEERGALTRADLIRQLMQLELPGEQKLTRAEARSVVTGCLDLMTEALRRGEVVEMPFGRLEVAEHNRKPVRGWFLGRVRVTYRKRKFVRFVATEGLL
jgi:nucleoid DNA-binding protein